MVESILLQFPVADLEPRHPRHLELIDQQAAAGELDVEAVMKAGFLDTLTGEQAENWRGPAKRAEVWVYDGSVPISMHCFDDSVVIWLGERRGDELVVRGLVESENSEVLSWADALYEEYRDEADRLEPEMLPEL